ncbi:unnamed protein product [Cercospora beticola]|nr:unnamed protein product [Cercospora beticola]
MPPLIVESSIWFSIVIIIAASRFASRWRARGFKPQADDILMLLAICFYIVFLVTINIVANTSSNLFPEGFDISSLTKADIQQRIRGSKLILVLENCQNVAIWLAKICVLILYLRLTTLRWQNIAIKVLLGGVIVAFVVMVILYLGVWCRPFSQYWAVPPNSSQCNAATNHLILNACLNLTSDLIMLAIGLPIFLKMKLPWRKKIPLVGIFSLGIFVILAAILNKVYSFSEPFGSMWTYWYVRESSTALLVANLPFVWGFWRKILGFKPSVAASMDTALPTHDESRRKNSALPPEFATVWRLQDDKDDDVELEDEFRRAGRSLTLAEFLREDPADYRRPPQYKGHAGQANNHGNCPVLQDFATHDRIRRTSDPETHGSQKSTQPASSLKASMDDRSAASFV